MEKPENKDVVKQDSPLQTDPPKNHKKPPKTVIREIRQEFSGPIPPPEILMQYKEVDPSFPDRIVAMTENNLRHIQRLQEQEIQNELRLGILGAVLGFIIGMTTVICGTVVILNGYEAAGTILAGAGLTSLVGTFVYGVKAKGSAQASTPPASKSTPQA